jgi:hypothetical protein
MGSVFQNFKDVIARAQAAEFPDLAKLVLRGKIDYAVERGDITLRQAAELDELLGHDVSERYADVLEIATFGDLDAPRQADLEKTPALR